ncbi:MAG: fibronectin type III-like domain-contianing protein [Candidatus Binatia bacterium]
MLGDYSDGPTTPLFPFGHGLSYTRFAYADLCIAPERAAADAPIEIACTVTNAGARPGTEVVQLYVRDLVGSVTRPVRQLVGFARLDLAAGAARRVRFRLDPSQLAFLDAAMRFVVEPGDFQVMVGASSADVRLEGGFVIEGETRVLPRLERAPTRVRIDE